MAQVFAGATQDPIAQAADEPRALGDGNESACLDPSHLAVVPARQSFQASNSTSREIDARLIKHIELVPFYGRAQTIFESNIFSRLQMQLSRKETIGILPCLFRKIHCGVGVLE